VEVAMKVLKFTSLLLALAVVVLASSVTPAAAQGPKIIQKDCDTLSFDPPRVRVTFAVVNLSPIPVCSIHLIPVPSGPYPPCEIFACSLPDSNWHCQLNPAGGADWQAIPTAGGPGGCILPYEKLEPFDFIIDPPYCCYRVLFDGPDGQIFGEDIVCFQCESPVSTYRSTWGSVKARYH
jgi:hypothetical protein